MDPVLPDKVSTGLSGLDHILRGGLPAGEVYLVEGGPGTGKTTLALQFLQTCRNEDRSVLYLTLSQTRRSLHAIARSHGWDLGEVEIREFKTLKEDEVQTVFPSAEVELEKTLAAIHSAIEEVQPEAVVIDTITDLRVLSSNASQYRRELLGLRHYLHAQGCTALFLDDRPHNGDQELRNQAHGIIMLEQETPEYGEVRRRLQVVKMRGTPILGGYHNFRISTGGLAVYPRIQANGENGHEAWGVMSSGVPALDEMLGGGLREGTACLVAGPTGCGKTTVGFQFAHAAAERGDGAAVFLFNERLETFYRRVQSVGVDLKAHVEGGRLHIEQINTGIISASEFAQKVRAAVEDHGARVVVIDSLSGYISAMLNRQLLVSQMHELITYLSQEGVLTMLIVDQHGAFSGVETSPAHVSYLADSVLLLRYHEVGGLRQRTISVMKQRHGAHDLGARALHISSHGIEIGERIDDYVSLMLDPPLFATFYPQHHDDGQPDTPRPAARS